MTMDYMIGSLPVKEVKTYLNDQYWIINSFELKYDIHCINIHHYYIFLTKTSLNKCLSKNDAFRSSEAK